MSKNKEKAEVKAVETSNLEQSELEKALTEENEKLIAENERLQKENDKLSQTCKRLQSSADKSDTYLNQLVAMKSDFESYKRRMKTNHQLAKDEGVSAVATKMFAILDTFEIAAKHLDGDNLKAFEMVQTQFMQTLAEFGVQEIDVLNQPFDANKMNALSKMDFGEDKRDLVVEVYKKGYELNGKILRYAEVIVGA